MFYDMFKKLCDAKGVSCNKAALEIGLSNATPTKWKKTNATPDSTTLAKVAAYFNVSISYLLGATDDPLDRTKTHWAKAVQDMKKAPTPEGGRLVSDEQLKFALWGDTSNIDDADLDDVRRYAAFVAERKKNKQ